MQKDIGYRSLELIRHGIIFFSHNKSVIQRSEQGNLLTRFVFTSPHCLSTFSYRNPELDRKCAATSIGIDFSSEKASFQPKLSFAGTAGTSVPPLLDTPPLISHFPPILEDLGILLFFFGSVQGSGRTLAGVTVHGFRLLNSDAHFVTVRSFHLHPLLNHYCCSLRLVVCEFKPI